MSKVTVLLSTYNGDKYLEQQLDSILNQKGNFDLNICIRDDNSTDNTRKLLESYSTLDNVKVIYGNNIGSAASFMWLLKNCGDADYIAFSDQDDVWNDNKIGRAISVLDNNANQPALYFSNAKVVDSNLNSLGKNVFNNPLKINYETVLCQSLAMGCTMVMNRKLVDIITGTVLPHTYIMHDSYIMAACAAIGGAIYYDDEATMKYRQHSNNAIGVSSTIRDKISEKFGIIFTRRKYGIADQGTDILNRYIKYMDDEHIQWLKKISSYRKNIFNAISLAMSRKTHYSSASMSVTIRLAILLLNY